MELNNLNDMSKKVIISGCTGQDGSYMAEYLLANTSDTLILLMRRTSQAIVSNLQNVLGNPRVKTVVADLCDGEAIRGVIRDEKPDYFINFGAQTFVADSWKNPVAHFQTNAISLIHILEAVKEYAPKCRVYSAGSSEMFGDVKYSPQDENHPFSPRSVYGVSKCAAGLLCKVYRESYGLYVVHGTLFNHESERRQNYFVTRKITQAVARIVLALKNGESFEPLKIGNIYAKRDWSHAEDFVDGIWKMLNQESPKEYVLSSGETHSVKEFIEKAFASAGFKVYESFAGTNEGNVVLPENVVMRLSGSDEIVVRIDPQFYRPAEVELLWGDSSRARKELGWSPKVSFDELVDRMVKNDMAELENKPLHK